MHIQYCRLYICWPYFHFYSLKWYSSSRLAELFSVKCPNLQNTWNAQMTLWRRNLKIWKATASKRHSQEATETRQFLWHNICKKILTIWKTQYCMQQSLTILYKFLTSQWLKTKVVSVYFTFAPSLSALFCVLLKIYYGLFHKV